MPTENNITQLTTNQDRLAAVLVDLDDMAEALARARAEVQRMRNAA